MGAYCAGLILLALLAGQDIKEKKISVDKLLVFACMAVLYRIFIKQFFWQEILGCMIPGTILLLLSWVTKEGIGYGDGMAVIVLGLWTGGWFALHVMGLGIMLCGMYAVICLVRKKRDAIPFIPFLLAGMEVALIYA